MVVLRARRSNTVCEEMWSSSSGVCCNVGQVKAREHERARGRVCPMQQADGDLKADLNQSRSVWW